MINPLEVAKLTGKRKPVIMKYLRSQISNGINLLPPQQKKELFHEQKYKLFLIFGVLAVVFLIALSLALFAIKIHISGESQGEKIIIPAQVQDYEKEILAINKNLQNLSSFYEEAPNFIKIIEEISKIVPQGIGLTSLSLNFSKKTRNFSAFLQGFSPDRELLFQFKKNLESDTSFKDVNFPPSSWVKPENIEFSISFKA